MMKNRSFALLALLHSAFLLSQNFYQVRSALNNINPNTENYDLTYQRLELELDPEIQKVAGKVTTHFVPNQETTSIYFDLADRLKVSRVSYHGQALEFAQLSSKELKITLTQTLKAGVQDSLSVEYSGAPDSRSRAFVTTRTPAGAPVLYTLSEPYGAREWFPTKQSMNDKIDRFDIKIITDAKYSVASNGRLVSENILPDGKKLTFWRTEYPTAAYLIALGISNYEKFYDSIGLQPAFPFVNYLYPHTAQNSSVLASIAWTKPAMVLFENHFGLYPFRKEKYGHMQFSERGTCMEHQTMSSMSSWELTTIAHELAHQWFGDKITCASWNDIWLNEGFATFGEHLVNEKLLMSPADFKVYLKNRISYITAYPGGSVYVADENLNNEGAIFSGRLSYAKGGFVVRMLKWVLGEDEFYRAIKNYLEDPDLAYSYAKTSDLAASLKKSTGQDFTEFFNDWIYGEGYPMYNISWNQVQSKFFLNVKQAQSHPSVSFFEMPLPVRVAGANGEVVDLVLENKMNDETFIRDIDFPIQSVTFNYDYQILEKNSVVKKDAQLQADATRIPQLKIYPNPAVSKISVSGISGWEFYQILNTEGKVLKSGKVSTDQPISVTELSPGLYFLNVNGQIFKFIKK